MAKKFGFFQIKSQNYDRVADEEENNFTDEKGLNTKPLGSNYRSLPWCITTFLVRRHGRSFLRAKSSTYQTR